MTAIKYHYAKNEQGVIVCIDDVTDDYRRVHQFFCIGCYEPMVARLGNKNTHHFAHAKDTVSCGTMTYLHKLAEALIYNKFYSSKSFKVAFYRDEQCVNATTCMFFRENECSKRRLVPFDLRDYFNECQIEQRVGDFVADLLISDNTGKYKDQVLIEINVTHECTERKQESGYRIIELSVSSEEDIIALLSSVITEDDMFGNLVRFYGFKDSVVGDIKNDSRLIHRFVLYPSGAAVVNRSEEGIDFTCGNLFTRASKHSVLELNIDCDYSLVYPVGYFIAMKKGLNINNCHLCKYSRDSNYDDRLFCCMSSKYGTPRNPGTKHANVCQYFSLDRNRLASEAVLQKDCIVQEVF